MQYVDKDFYLNVYKGTTIPESEIEQKLMLASLDIDTLTFNRVQHKFEHDKLTRFQLERIKLAVCMQADFTHTYSDMLESPLSSYSAGTVSVNLNTTSIVTHNGVNTSAKCFSVLQQTGLTVRLFI